jgi:hypothetical protein
MREVLYQPRKEKSSFASKAAADVPLKDWELLTLGRGLNSDRRRTNEEAQIGNGALALYFIRDSKSFNGMKNQQQVNRYRRRIGMNGQADDTRRRVLRDCGVGVAMGCFQSGHKQGKHNADHRDQAHQLTALELTGSGLHGRLRRGDTAPLHDSAYSNFHSLANVCFCIDAGCSILSTHESV